MPKTGCSNSAADYGKHERVVLFKYSMENGHSKIRFYLSTLPDNEPAAQNGKGLEFEHAFELQDAKAPEKTNARFHLPGFYHSKDPAEYYIQLIISCRHV
jgi:hypothetical protein